MRCLRLRASTRRDAGELKVWHCTPCPPANPDTRRRRSAFPSKNLFAAEVKVSDTVSFYMPRFPFLSPDNAILLDLVEKGEEFYEKN